MLHLRNEYSFNKHLWSSCYTPYTMPGVPEKVSENSL